MSGLTGALQILQGVEAFKAGKEEGRAQRRQGAVALRESETMADIRGEEVEELGQRQKLQFLKSGVRLKGTPLTVLANTAERGREEVSSILEAGRARGGLFRSRGRIAERGGRAGFLSGLAGGTASIAAQHERDVGHRGEG